MRSILILPFLITGCGPTDTALDDLYLPMQKCKAGLTVENRGTQPLAMRVSVSRTINDDRCDDSTSRVEKTVAPGTTENGYVYIKCRFCNSVSRYHTVELGNTQIYQNSNQYNSLACDNSNCVAK